MAVVVRVPVIDVGITLDPKLLAAPTSCAQPSADPQASVRTPALCFAGALAVVLAAVVWLRYGAQHGVYVILGLLLGVALFHSRFGFAMGWQRLVSVGNGQSVRAFSVLLGTAATVVMLVCATGAGLYGATPDPVANPLGVALVLGATLFGIGMQLAGSCASGTLFAVGTGQSAIVPTLGAFIAGSVVCTWASPLVEQLPKTKGVLLADQVGWLGSWAITVAVLLGIAGLTWFVQWRRKPPPTAPVATAHGIARLYRGSWPMLAGAIVFGLLAGLVFLTSGRTLGAANAFSLWGAKILQLAGMHPENWQYWQTSVDAPSLGAPLLTDRTSLTDFGIMIGAAAAAAAAGAWRMHVRMPSRTVLAALLGGFLMGVGTRMANGCNIGALIGGVSAGSVSGWIWGVCALAGTLLGVKLRPLFGLYNPKPEDGIC